MTTLHERYPELFTDHNDPALTRLVADLESACRPAAPPPRLRAALRQALHDGMPETREPAGVRRRRRLFAPSWARRRAGVTVALLTAVIVAGAAYAAAPLVNQAFSGSPGMQQIVSQNLGQQVNVAQSACGFTLTINRIYADENLTVIGYTLSGPDGRRFLPAIGQVARDLPSPDGLPTTVDVPTLTTASGATAWPVSFGSGGTLLNAGAQYLAFNTREIAPGAATLALRLTVPAIQMFEQLAGAAPAAVACEQYSPMRDSVGMYVNGQLFSIARDHGRVVTVPGPFTFNLSVPVSPNVRDYAPQQTVTQADGTVVTLQRVVVTRTDTRLYIATNARQQIYPTLTVAQAPPSGIQPAQDPMMTSAQKGQTTYAAIPIRYHNGTDGSTVGEYLIDAPLYDYHGDWTLVVQTHVTGADQGRPAYHGAPVTFHVTVP